MKRIAKLEPGGLRSRTSAETAAAEEGEAKVGSQHLRNQRRTMELLRMQKKRYEDRDFTFADKRRVMPIADVPRDMIRTLKRKIKTNKKASERYMFQKYRESASKSNDYW